MAAADEDPLCSPINGQEGCELEVALCLGFSPHGGCQPPTGRNEADTKKTDDRKKECLKHSSSCSAAVPKANSIIVLTLA